VAKRPKVEPIRNPTLFEMDKLEQAGNLVNSLNVERPYSEPGLLLGTSAFTANGWAGAFYPPGKPAPSRKSTGINLPAEYSCSDRIPTGRVSSGEF
jgi:hypothetical protein